MKGRRRRKRPDGEKVQCEECGRRYDLEWHHIEYLSNGGSDEPDNLQVLCKPCHRLIHKNAGDFVEFGIKGGKKRQAKLKVQLGEKKYNQYQKTLALIRWGKVRQGEHKQLLQN